MKIKNLVLTGLVMSLVASSCFADDGSGSGSGSDDVGGFRSILESRMSSSDADTESLQARLSAIRSGDQADSQAAAQGGDVLQSAGTQLDMAAGGAAGARDGNPADAVNDPTEE